MMLIAAVLAALLVAVLPARAAGQRAIYAGLDSADVAEEVLAGVDPADIDDVAEALELATYDRHRWSGTGGFVRLDLVSGYRRDARFTTGTRRLALGVRRRDGTTPVWLDVRPARWLDRVVIGGVRPRCGEGLILGARRSRFGASANAQGAAAQGLTVAPSLTLWSRKQGAAMSLHLRSYRLAAAFWDESDGAGGRWASVQRGGFAVSAGLIDVPPEEGDGERRAVSVSGARDIDGARVSGEVAWLGSVTLGVVRATVRAAGDWTAELYRGTGEASGGIATIDEHLADGERGAAIHRSVRWGRWRSTVSFHTVTRRGREGERSRRRVGVRGVYVTPSGTRCDLSARYDLDAETEVPTALLAEHLVDTRTIRGRIRARLDVPAGPSLSFRYKAQALLAPGSRPGFIAGVDVRRTGRRIDLRMSVTNFALWNGGGGYVTRPGIAGYETVSSVDRRGSDVSTRVTLRLGGGVSTEVYAGVPWEKEPRYLVSLKWRL